MYRKMCILCQQTSPKRWFGNRTMTSFCDVTNSAHVWLPEMITIRFAGWISGRIVSLQLDKDIQKLLSNRNRIRIRISEMLLSIFRGFRLLEKVAHCTIIHLSAEASFQPSAPWLRVSLLCNLWTVEWVMPSLSACFCSSMNLLVWQDRALFQCTLTD